MVDPDDGTDINVWVSFADVFAGLLLITLMGLGVAMHTYQARRPTDVRFSENLVQSMNLATSVTKALEEKLQKVLKSSGPQTSETEVVIPAEALFASGGYDAEAGGMLLLTDIRQALREALDGVGERRRFLRVIIEGHTDSDPIRISAVTREIPTNWELSSRRATGVLRFFEKGGLAPTDYNIVAMGLADSMPITFGDKKRNRRIVIRIEPDIEVILQSIAGR